MFMCICASKIEKHTFYRNMDTPGFYRFAKFLNFRRSFPNPVTSLVHIPSFSYQDIDNTGTKVQIWSVARLFEASRAFSFCKGPTMDCPETSHVDMNELLQSHLCFIAGSSIRVEKDFYLPESPKFPLYIRTTVHGLGSRSFAFRGELFHEGTDALFATNNITVVIVSKETRRPTQLPEWWLQKFSGLIKGERMKPYVFVEPSGIDYSSALTVRNSETDTNSHANWSTYIEHCCDNLYSGIMADKFPGLKKYHWDAGIRDLEMSFKSESSTGDRLTLESWKTPSDQDSACCRVMKSPDVCFNAKFSFYTNAAKHKL